MQKTNYKIAIFTHNYPINSIERKDAGVFIHDFAHELAKNASVLVFCPDFGGDKEKYNKVPVTWFNWGGPGEKFGNWSFINPLSVIYFFKLIIIGRRKAIKFAKKNKIDFVLAAWNLPSSVIAMLVKLELKIPYAAWSLGSDLNRFVNFPILRQLIVSALKFADVRFANSYLLVRKVKNISGKSCTFLPAITDFKKTKVKPVKVNKSLLNFLSVGRLENIKGPDILVEACRILATKRNDFFVNILGGGSMMGQLKEKVDRYNLGNLVNLVGWADEEKVMSFMKASDCLVISSRSESLPLVLIEAANMGLPVIALNVGDCGRLIKQYKIGMAVKPKTPSDLALAMETMIQKRKACKLKYRRGLKRVKGEFIQRKAVETFLTEIGNII